MSNSDEQLILDEYDRQHLLYPDLCLGLKTLLHALVDSKVKIHSITERIKTRESLSNKIKAKNKYKVLREITDVLGLRIITYFADDVDKVAAVLEREFKVDRKNSIDKRQALDPDRFGYLSLHYVVSLSEKRLEMDEYNKYTDCCFEIQIRSLLQHTWAEIEHDVGYKTSSSVPKEVKRRFSRLAGLLELADEEFNGIKVNIINYKNEVESKISEDALEQVFIDLESVMQFLKGDPLVKALSNQIAQRARVSLYDYLIESDLADLIDILKGAGFNNLAEVKRDLKTYGEQVVNFALEWLPIIPNIFFTTEVTLIHLCYVKLGLLKDVAQITAKSKKSRPWVTDEEAKRIAQRIVEVSHKIKLIPSQFE